MSALQTFTTALPAGDRTPYQAIVYGDMGIDPYPQGKTTAKLVLNDILTNEYRFILHHGDISYALGHVRLIGHLVLIHITFLNLLKIMISIFPLFS